MRIRHGFEEKSRLGRLLINRGYLSEGQLEEGLRLQRDTGQRLGEVFIQAGWITEKELHRVLKHQSRYRNTAALVTVVTLPFQPLVSFAASNTASAGQMAEAGQLFEGSGLSELTEQELAAVSGQGDPTLLARLSSVASMPSERVASHGKTVKPDAVEGIRLMANAFIPVLSFLDSDLTISGVHYREGKPRYKVQGDGGLRLAMPERIEQIRMDNIRVSGGQGPSMGNVSIHDIRFHPDSHVTLYTR